MVRGGDQEAARRPPSIPGLSRRSGRIPALPYPPIKLSYYKTTWQNRQTKKHPFWQKQQKMRGGGGGKPPPLEIGPLCHKVAGPGAARRTGQDFSGHFRGISEIGRASGRGR